jgi:uncharacterized protein YndB with AHSA1/START domain
MRAMARQVVDESARSSAPPEAVWAVLADLASWSVWGDWSKTTVDTEGDDPPGGVGAKRSLTRFPFVSREEVTAWEPPRRFAYVLNRGMPLRDYRSEVTLTPAAGNGTDIRWRSEFDPKIPGTGALFRRGLRDFIADHAQRLARAAESGSA